jgi:hypothetical protein
MAGKTAAEAGRTGMARAVKRLARLLRRLADLLDYDGAPRPTRWSFTYEEGRGAVFWENGPGCLLWYVGEAEYVKAWDEAGPVPGTGDQWRRRESSPNLKQEGTES